MQDIRALKNSRNLSSWRAWEKEAYRHSGAGGLWSIYPLLVIVFVFAITLPGRALGRVEAPAVLIGMGLYIAASLGLGFFGMLRLKAWKRANPWTPPS